MSRLTLGNDCARHGRLGVRSVRGKLMVLAGLVATLAACSPPPPPTYSADAFKGIYNRSSATVPADQPVTVQPPVGIIFSDNVELYLGSVKEAGDYWSKVVPEALKNNVVYADADPTYFAGRALAMLKGHFPTATVIHDFNEAVSTGKKSVVLIDLHVKMMEPYGDRTTKYDIDAYFFDSAMNPVSRLSGHGEYHVPYASMTAGIQRSIDTALQQLSAKIDTLARQSGV
jgi:hypothetical protein